MESLSKRIPITRSADGRVASLSTPPHDRVRGSGVAAGPVSLSAVGWLLHWGGRYRVAPRAPVRLTRVAAAKDPPVADAQRDACGVAVLQQRLRVLARRAEVVAQARDRHLAVALDQFDDAPLDVREGLDVDVHRRAEPHGPASGPQGGEVAGVELGVERRRVP